MDEETDVNTCEILDKERIQQYKFERISTALIPLGKDGSLLKGPDRRRSYDIESSSTDTEQSAFRTGSHSGGHPIELHHFSKLRFNRVGL